MVNRYLLLSVHAWIVTASVAHAQSITLREAQLVDEGFRIFTEEKFEGNGRTCSTCHLPEAHYTIGPRDIAAMAETDRALVMAENVPGLENPVLVNKLALFNKGETKAAPVFRGSMTIAALELTTRNNLDSFPGPFGPQLGWAGDGSPRDGTDHDNADAAADGSIRAFTNGAIAQHSTKSLDRIADVDFRFATDDELDALDAFQRWLGRRAVGNGREELDLNTLTFADLAVEQGKFLYLSPQATCNDCHTNAGATFTGVPPVPPVGSNFNLETGVESERARLSAETGVCIPEDKGGQSTPPPGVAAELGSFNLQSIIEAPRKHAFFHNSAVVGDVEDAAAFYFTGSFLNSPTHVTFPDRPAHCESLECLEEITPQALEKLGAFLRSLSAFYALRDCERLVQESIDRIEIGASVDVPLKHCVFALRDVSGVLEGSHLSPPPFEAVAQQAGRLAEALDTKVCSAHIHPESLARTLRALSTLRAALATTAEFTEPDD